EPYFSALKRILRSNTKCALTCYKCALLPEMGLSLTLLVLNTIFQITSTGEAASTQTESGRIVPDFDLNEVPEIMMEDEGGDANANS
nr:hypothetical protein [Tanacetum cinerariifolium]